MVCKLKSPDDIVSVFTTVFHGTLLFLLISIADSFQLEYPRNQFRSKQRTTSPLPSFPPRQSYAGLSSSPGWKRGQLDTLTDWAVSNAANRPVICEYEPDGAWLWSKWRGTVLNLTYPAVIFNIAASVAMVFSVRELADSTLPFFAIPPQDEPFMQQLHGFNSCGDTM